jgi:hypothetical protein
LESDEFYDPTWKHEIAVELERTTEEIFGLESDQDEPWNRAWLHINPNMPSLSANYNFTCSKGGAMGFLDEDARKHFANVPQTSKVVLTGVKDFLSIHYGWKGVDDYFQYDPDDGRIEDVRLGVELDNRVFLEKYAEFYSNQFVLARDEEALVKAVGLKEALKIRVISKGPPRLYFVLKPVQQFMWRRLQRFWNFELTGRMITEQLLNQRFCRPAKGSRFSSGDYSAATDELHSWVSEVICAQLIKLWEKQSGEDLTDLHWLMLKALTGHGYVNNLGEIRAQMRGQLMGSIISFVFLCIANITLIRMAYEKAHNVKVTLRNLPTWVNGDDCFTVYTSSHYPPIWEALGKVMGLTKSIGKSYDSKRFGTVNSRFFQLREDGQWSMVPFVNMGLANGIKRSVAVKTDEKEHPLELQAKYRELKDTCGDIDIDHYFIYKNGKALRDAKLPYGIPQHFCGLGISSKRTEEEMGIVTEVRRMYRQGMEVPRVVTNAEFQLHREVMGELKRRHPRVSEVQFQKYACDNTYGNAYVSLAYAAWAKKGIDGLFLEKNNSTRGYDLALNRMRRIWTTATKRYHGAKKAGFSKLTDVAKLERESKNFSYPLMTIGF